MLHDLAEHVLKLPELILAGLTALDRVSNALNNSLYSRRIFLHLDSDSRIFNVPEQSIVTVHLVRLDISSRHQFLLKYRVLVESFWGGLVLNCTFI